MTNLFTLLRKAFPFLLTHKDINLGYFEFVQHRMNGIASGDPLTITSEGLSTGKGLVVKFSNDFITSIEKNSLR